MRLERDRFDRFRRRDRSDGRHGHEWDEWHERDQRCDWSDGCDWPDRRDRIGRRFSGSYRDQDSVSRCPHERDHDLHEHRQRSHRGKLGRVRVRVVRAQRSRWRQHRLHDRCLRRDGNDVHDDDRDGHSPAGYLRHDGWSRSGRQDRHGPDQMHGQRDGDQRLGNGRLGRSGADVHGTRSQLATRRQLLRGSNGRAAHGPPFLFLPGLSFRAVPKFIQPRPLPGRLFVTSGQSPSLDDPRSG